MSKGTHTNWKSLSLSVYIKIALSPILFSQKWHLHNLRWAVGNWNLFICGVVLQKLHNRWRWITELSLYCKRTPVEEEEEIKEVDLMSVIMLQRKAMRRRAEDYSNNLQRTLRLQSKSLSPLPGHVHKRCVY